MTSFTFKFFFRTTFILFFISNLNIQAQEYSFFSDNSGLDKEHTEKAYFVVDNISFFKNNEYFNNLYDGITYLGNRIHPQIKYFPVNNFSLSAGLNLQSFAGREKLYYAQPTFTAEWLFSPGYRLIMGNIRGNLNHGLPDPLFSFDRYYTSPDERGIQILADTKYHKTDIWLNWEKFILPGDDFKEEFTAGGKTNILVLNPNKGVGISIPLAGMAMHKGGQVENTEGHLQTVFNTAAGINLFYKPFQDKKDSIGIQSLFLSFTDASPYKNLLYSKGWGVYSNFYYKLTDWYFEGGYWYGKHFIAPRGEWLFQSVSEKYSLYWESSKSLIFAKLGWTHEIAEGINAGTGGGLYYDTKRATLDFYYQLHLIVNLNFPLKQKKGNL